ncbi:MAG: heat shock protein 15 [Gammaproteobacteria bacterium]|nr:MAG: heat shock protein 15 [Gammaproteobacteria bacterium]
MPVEEAGQRLDKWLWAARLFKTRSLAAAAIDGGHVWCNGQRVKPARRVRPGDRLRLRKGPYEMEIEVLGLCAQRRPAVEAQALYRESEASRRAREALAEQRRMAAAQAPSRRPDKQGRRRLQRIKRGQG